MLFFIRSKVVHVDCFTCRNTVYQNSSIQYSSHFFPEWWKKLDKSINLNDGLVNVDYPTMKSCQGFLDYFGNSLTIPLWSDLAVRVGPINSNKLSWKFSDATTDCVIHPTFQRGEEYLPDKNYVHLKILSPWLLKCKDDINFSFQGAFWNFKEPESVIIPPGILNFKYQSDTNINTFFTREKQNKNIFFKFGQPLVQIRPYSERRLKIKTHLIDEKEFSNMHLPRISFGKTYKIFKNVSSSKCPMGF